LIFSGITIISKGKALKKEKRVVKETTFFIDNGDVGTNMPFTKVSLPPRAGRKDCYFENESLDSKTHYLESSTNTGRLITFQFFAMPPGITNVGLDPLSVLSSLMYSGRLTGLSSTSHFSHYGRRTRRQ